MIDLTAIPVTCERCHQPITTATATTDVIDLTDAITAHRRTHHCSDDLEHAR